MQKEGIKLYIKKILHKFSKYKSNTFIDFFSKKPRLQRHREAGFGLIELSVVMVIVGLITAAVLMAMKISVEQKKISDAKLALSTLDDTLHDFYLAHGRFPCPASTDAAPESAEFGREISCDGGAHDGTTVTTGRNGLKIRIGTVPVRTLNLPSLAIQDPWKNRIIYAVTEVWADEELTNNPADGGAIDVRDSVGNSVLSPPESARYVIVEPGANALGALNFAGILKAPCEGEGHDTENCNNDSVFVATDISEGKQDHYYDDYISYGKPLVAASLLPDVPEPVGVPAVVDKIVNCSSELKFYDKNKDTCVAPPVKTVTVASSKPATSAPSTPAPKPEPKPKPEPFYLSNYICSGAKYMGVINCYKQYLGRCADEGGYTYYGDKIVNYGDSIEKVCNDIRISTEAANYARTGVPTTYCPAGYKYRKNTNYCDPR